MRRAFTAHPLAGSGPAVWLTLRAAGPPFSTPTHDRSWLNRQRLLCLFSPPCFDKGGPSPWPGSHQRYARTCEWRPRRSTRTLFYNQLPPPCQAQWCHELTRYRAMTTSPINWDPCQSRRSQHGGLVRLLHERPVRPPSTFGWGRKFAGRSKVLAGSVQQAVDAIFPFMMVHL